MFFLFLSSGRHVLDRVRVDFLLKKNSPRNCLPNWSLSYPEGFFEIPVLQGKIQPAAPWAWGHDQLLDWPVLQENQVLTNPGTPWPLAIDMHERLIAQATELGSSMISHQGKKYRSYVDDKLEGPGKHFEYFVQIPDLKNCP